MNKMPSKKQILIDLNMNSFMAINISTLLFFIINYDLGAVLSSSDEMLSYDFFYNSIYNLFGGLSFIIMWVCGVVFFTAIPIFIVHCIYSLPIVTFLIKKDNMNMLTWIALSYIPFIALFFTLFLFFDFDEGVDIWPYIYFSPLYVAYMTRKNILKSQENNGKELV